MILSCPSIHCGLLICPENFVLKESPEATPSRSPLQKNSIHLYRMEFIVKQGIKKKR